MHIKFVTPPLPPREKIKQGGTRPVRRSWNHLCLYTIDFVEIRYHYTLNCEDAAFSTLMVN